MGIMSWLASPLVNVAESAIKRVLPDLSSPEVRAFKLELNEELHKHEETLSQLAINQEEAKNPSLFVSGWRPATAWVCVIALAWTFVIQPVVVFVLEFAKITAPTLPSMSFDQLLPILMGLLGLTVARSVERVKGVAPRRA